MLRSKTIIILTLILAFGAMAVVQGLPAKYAREWALGQAAFEPKDDDAIETIRSFAQNRGANIHKTTRVLNIWLITWEPQIDTETLENARVAGDYETYLDLYQQAENEVLDIVEMLENRGFVKWACPNYLRYQTYTPNDPWFPDDGEHTDASGPDQFYLHVVNADLAWDIELGSPDVLIAILDSGTDVDHPDLWDNIWVNPGEDTDADGVLYDIDDLDGIDNDGNGYSDDLFGYDFAGGVTGEETTPPDQEDWNPDIHYSGDDGWGEPDPSCGNGTSSFPLLFPPDQGVAHGTHTSGIAGAVMDNDTMYAGAAGGGCRIVPVRVGNPEGSMTATDIAAGIEYAVIGAGANVISMSLGSTSSEAEPIESLAIELAWSAGLTIVCASGNFAGMPFFGNDSVGYPASATKTIAVGSCDSDGNRASYSQYGSMLDVVVPGGVNEVETIWSTWVVSVAEADDDPSLEPGDHHYFHAEGTSMACPLVAGICGLILSIDPTLDNEQVRAVLQSTAVDVMAPGWDGQTAHGLVDAYAAVDFVSNIDERKLPAISQLSISPNPFNAACRITAPGEIEIFDVSGRLVRKLTPNSDSHVIWDGSDENGKSLPSGLYLARASTPQGYETKSITLLR